MLARSATTGRRTFGGLGKDLRSTSSGKSGWFGQCSGCQHGHCARRPSGPEPRAEANAQEDERPRDPTIWASDADWQELAVVLVNRNICELIEFNDIAEVNGWKVLGGLMGVANAGNDRNTGPQRLIMNIKVPNWAQNVIAGDMPRKMGKLWFGPEKIPNAVSTCSKFPNRGANGWPLQPPWPAVVSILAALGKSTSVRKLSPWGGFQPPESSNTSIVGC